MSAALLTATVIATGTLIASLVLGFTAVSAEEVLRHTTIGIFATLLVLLSHSLTMFYLIGKGRAVRDAVAEGALSWEFVRRISRARAPVFSTGTLAIALTMATAIIGGGVDTRVVPAIVHTVLGVLAVAANLVALRAEIVALRRSARVVDEVNELLTAR